MGELNITRRTAVVAAGATALAMAGVGGALAQAGVSSSLFGILSAWSEATDESDVKILSDNSNLFAPRDRVRKGILQVSYMNTDISGATAYWGSDYGLMDDGHGNTPCRNHAFGRDLYDEASPWITDGTVDTLTGAQLAANPNQSALDNGVPNHHVVSYGVWDASSFGWPVCDALSGFGLHNINDITWGSWGEYACEDYDSGAIPYTGDCAFPLLTCPCKLTCYSADLRYDAQGAAYFYYRLFFYADCSCVSGSIQRYAGMTYATAPGARVRLRVQSDDYAEACRICIENAIRGLLRQQPDNDVVAELVQKAQSGELTLPQAVAQALGSTGYHSVFDTAAEAAHAAYQCLLGRSASDAEAASYAGTCESGGLSQLAQSLLQNGRTSGEVGYPVDLSGFKAAVYCDSALTNCYWAPSEATDAAGTLVSNTMFNHGTFYARALSAPSGWRISSAASSVAVPDTGSMCQFDAVLNAALTVMPKEYVSYTIRYFVDGHNVREDTCGNLGEYEVVRPSELALSSLPSYDEEETAGIGEHWYKVPVSFESQALPDASQIWKTPLSSAEEVVNLYTFTYRAPQVTFAWTDAAREVLGAGGIHWMDGESEISTEPEEGLPSPERMLVPPARPYGQPRGARYQLWVDSDGLLAQAPAAIADANYFDAQGLSIISSSQSVTRSFTAYLDITPGAFDAVRSYGGRGIS